MLSHYSFLLTVHIVHRLTVSQHNTSCRSYMLIVPAMMPIGWYT